MADYSGWNKMFNNVSIEEYPFVGEFFRPMIDTSLPLDQREDKEMLILRTPCDIQESERTMAKDFIVGVYKVYFPFDTQSRIPIMKGDNFIGTMFGVQVNGKVFGIYPSLLGGVEVTIKDFDAQ